MRWIGIRPMLLSMGLLRCGVKLLQSWLSARIRTLLDISGQLKSTKLGVHLDIDTSTKFGRDELIDIPHHILLVFRQPNIRD